MTFDNKKKVVTSFPADYIQTPISFLLSFLVDYNFSYNSIIILYNRIRLLGRKILGLQKKLFLR